MEFRRLSLMGGLCIVLGLSLAPAANANESQKQISAHLANEVIPLTSSASTVAGLLDELSIELPSEAGIDPPPDAALKDGMQVFMRGLHVTRGEALTVVPAETQIVEKCRFGPAGVEVVSPGCDGLVESTITVFFMGDKEVGRRERSETIRRMQPRKLVCYRALDPGLAGPSVETILRERIKPGSDTPPPAHYARKLSMESTAYEPGPESCGIYAGGKTSAGLEPGYGIAAVDPDVIPLGTRLYIEGYGYAVAGDTGSAIKGKVVDVCFMTVDECYEWGRREVTVYILE